MRKLQSQKGFTLVELAIVMTIIGLLVGGILKGQELIQTARVTSTIAQVRAYESAITAFRDAYNGLPGDLTNAGTRIPGCAVLPGNGAACNAAAAFGNNGIIGAVATSTTAASGIAQGTATVAAPNAAANETYLFWAHLALGNYISEISDRGVRAAIAYEAGVTHPAAKSGGGFVVANMNGPVPGSIANMQQASGLGLFMVQNVAVANPVLITANTQPLRPALAAQIDRKMDDGRPGSGFVLAYGVSNSCYNAAGAAAVQGQYLESVATTDCGLLFRIQG